MVERLPSDDEDEFQFSEAEQSDAYTEDEPLRQSSVLERINRRSILIAIGIIVLAIIIFKVLQSFLAGDYTHRTQTPPPVIPQESQVNVPTGIQNTPTVSQPQPQGFSIESQNQLTQQLNDMQAAADDNKQKINAINDSLTSLSTTVSTMQQSLNEVTQQLQTIAQQLQQQQTQISMLIPKKLPPKKKIIFKPRPRPPILFVQAIIPGRAWLVLPNGLTLTVRIGDLLPGYGKVTYISPIQGTVVTSSGAIIRYRD